jgi:hypothetical protein
MEVDGKMSILTDSKGHPIDADGELIGWPNRSGNLEIINGNRLTAKQLNIEIVVPLNANPPSVYAFTDQPLLRNTALWGIEFYTDGDTPISPISGLPVTMGIVTAGGGAKNSMLPYMYLWMQEYSNSYNFFQNKPCIKFHTTVNGGGTSAPDPYVTNPEGLIGQHVNWPNGYIKFSDITINGTNPFTTASYALNMDIYYSVYNNWQCDGLGGSFGLR